MNQTPHQHQPYCDQLLLDCNDPIFQGSLFVGKNGDPTKKMRDLRSPNSEDAVTWSVFRLLGRHFAGLHWLSQLLALAGCDLQASGTPQVSFWEKGFPSKERLLWLLNHTQDPRMAESDGAGEDPNRLRLVRQHLDEYTRHINDEKTRSKQKWILEGDTEFDLIIRCPGLLVAVEAKLYRAHRRQVPLYLDGIRLDGQRSLVVAHHIVQFAPLSVNRSQRDPRLSVIRIDVQRRLELFDGF